MTNGNEPAFSKAAFYHAEGGIDSPQEGLSKREYFAAMAMQSLITVRDNVEDRDIESIVIDAEEFAEKLIRALNRNF